MVPFHLQLQVDASSSAAIFWIFTFLAPGVHGEPVTGIQGAGVWTPCADKQTDEGKQSA